MPLLVGPLLLLGFVWWENRTAHPMLPLELFRVRNFSVGNIATFVIYAGLSVATFLIAVSAQQLGGYSALQAGLCLLPVTLIMFVLSPYFGKLSGTYGPRWFMTLGPITCGLGLLSLLRINQSFNYPTQILPGVLAFGIGLSITVAPLTSAVLGSIDSRHAGIASAVNNAIARIAGLLAIAGIGVIIGGAELTLIGFQRGIVVMSALLVSGGIISAWGIRNVDLHP
jgi:predicted MFS family arabinose efflux permease